MTFSLDAAQVNEAKHILASLGYCDASAEDIALTLEHMREASRSCGKRQSTPIITKLENSVSVTSVSPPRGSNDITVVPHDNEKAVGRSDEENQRSVSASPSHTPGVRPSSARERSTTTATRTGKWRYPRRGQKPNREYIHQQPFYSIRAAAGRDGNQQCFSAERRDVRYVDPIGPHFADEEINTTINDAFTIPTGVVAAKEHKNNRPYSTLVDYMNPQARLERHLKRYVRGLKTLYANRCEEDAKNGLLNDEEYDEVRGVEGAWDYLKAVVDNEGCENNLALFYRDNSQRLLMPEMPLRPSRVLLNRRNANTFYNFTGDSRYKYRGGLGVPLCAVLGPNGSTLRHRADPVKRGQQMREIWEKNKFLAQHCRNKDRWSMN